MASSANAAVDVVTLFKNITREQTSAAQPVTPTGAFFSSSVEESSATDSTAATISYPGPGSPKAMPKDGARFEGFSSFATPAAMDAAFPYGSPYTFNISGGTLGSQSSSIATPAVAPFAAAVPYLTGTSYAATQGLNAAAANTLTYNGFTTPAGATESFTFVTVRRVSDNATVFTNGFLSPSATAFTIPADTLAANTAYLLELDFSARINGTAFGSAASVEGFEQRTFVAFTTAVPEPAAFAMIGFGAAMGLRRRRPGGRA